MNEKYINKELENKMDEVLDIVVLGRNARNSGNVKNRQPIATMYVLGEKLDDLYLDINRKEMSVKKYRSQTDIEKSYLHKQLEVVNTMLFNAKPRNVYLKSYGDLYISFYRKGIVLEILNDTHLENACLFRVIYKTDKITYSYECIVKNNKLVFSGINF